ncbi:ATP-binding cassette domain-containing protein [Halorubrum sp. CBA1125]|uniref:ABC transporter ATP-binding protein n=1 Tax=Halorubrum sp. CBA1125 TaxID=2668072 RepID=UPI0012E6FAA9|nr:energy-coupling factor transporter ATPase [Halorubrum sp. CBA1125]MUW13446.1 ATP-binding cassette domain-containing protein [Halorubrum sp. CBA1125]
MTEINFNDVSFRYTTKRDVAAVHELDFTIESGEFVGITGPSDAGKTTLARLIPGYIPHFYDGQMAGTVQVGGIDVRESSMRELSDQVGFLFENPFNQLTGASMTVLEEVAFGLEQMGVEREKIFGRVDEALETVGIADLIRRKPQELSGGQSQRVAIASILALEPDVLVLDEPTSQLDPHGTEEVFQVLANMDRKEYTMVIISHDLERLVPHLDRLMVVDGGSVALDDTPQNVLSSDDEVINQLNVPESIEIGKYLRDKGLVSPEKHLPLSVADTVEELSPHVRRSGRPEPSTTNGGVDRDVGPASNPATDVEDPLIKFENVDYYYNNEIQALQDISIEMAEGCVCVIGQNGAGKTTFVKHLNGLLKPTNGTVYVNGIDTQDNSIAQLSRHVGLSFQNPDDQIFHDTVEKEIRFGPKNLGYPEERIDELVDRQLERFELEDVRDEDPYNHGLATRKHIAVASVLAMDTPVVVLDEPTGGQDKPGNELLGDVIDDLVSEGKLVITITHDIPFARDHADRVIALCNAEVLIDGSPREVFNEGSTLAETMVEPPKVTQIGKQLDLPRTLLTNDELFKYVDTSAD